MHSRDKPLAADIDLDVVARQTSGLTGADLANICNEAAIFAGRAHRKVVQTTDFQAALERVVAGMQSRRVITDHEKRVVAYHEAGHALCSQLLPSVEKVHRISIVPRGQALGYTLNLPEEDRYLKTQEELMDYLVVLLGGRVTENLIFGQITTGASDDLRKVHEISRSMVTDYGMGTNLQSKQLPAGDYSMADATRRMIDEEQQHIADEAHRRAARMVAGTPPAAGGLRGQAARERGAGARRHRAHHRRVRGRGRPAAAPGAAGRHRQRAAPTRGRQPASSGSNPRAAE